MFFASQFSEMSQMFRLVMPTTQIVTASSQKKKLSDVFCYQFTIERNDDMVEIVFPRCHIFEKRTKKKRWLLTPAERKCLIAYDWDSTICQASQFSRRGRASQHRIAQHCDFVVGRHDRIFVGGECSSPYWLLGDWLSLSPCCTLQRRSTRWELCYRSALERRLSTGQKVRLYRGLMLLYKECRKKKERKEKEILVSPSRIAVRFERLQFVFVFYVVFYFILFFWLIWNRKTSSSLVGHGLLCVHLLY